MRRIKALCAGIGLLASGFLAAQEAEVLRIDLPDHPTAVLEPCCSFECIFLSESSGIVRSRTDPEVFWTHNDSGDFARIFPIDREGTVIDSHIRIKGASNRDWEDIATDDRGRLLIADLGNNLNTRRDLAIYIVPEPTPAGERAVEGARRIPVHYPDQQAFPPPLKNFDAEALFWARGSIYVLTKHRSDTATTLYRLDTMDEKASNPLTRLSSFDVGGQVTGADASADGRRVVVLTYGALWVFEADTDDYFRGSIRWLPITAAQCEGVCFDGANIVITNEQRQIFRVPVERLLVLRR